MLDQARALARHGHRVPMIEAVLAANGFPEAAEWIDQPHIYRELQLLADEARKSRAPAAQDAENGKPGEND